MKHYTHIPIIIKIFFSKIKNQLSTSIKTLHTYSALEFMKDDIFCVLCIPWHSTSKIHVLVYLKTKGWLRECIGMYLPLVGQEVFI